MGIQTSKNPEIVEVNTRIDNLSDYCNQLKQEVQHVNTLNQTTFDMADTNVKDIAEMQTRMDRFAIHLHELGHLMTGYKVALLQRVEALENGGTSEACRDYLINDVLRKTCEDLEDADPDGMPPPRAVAERMTTDEVEHFIQLFRQRNNDLRDLRRALAKACDERDDAQKRLKEIQRVLGDTPAEEE